MPGFYRNISSGYATLPPVPKSFLLVFITYCILAILYFSVRSVIGIKAADAMDPYNSSNIIIAKNINAANVPVLGNDSYIKTFRLQNDIIDLRRNHHFKVAMTFLKNYYAIISCLIFISCIGGLLLFVLINQGWEKKLLHHQSAFFIAGIGRCVVQPFFKCI